MEATSGNPHFGAVKLILALGLICGGASPVIAEDSEAVRRGRRALERLNPPWYDRQKDRVVPVDGGQSPDDDAESQATQQERVSLFWQVVQQLFRVLLWVLLAGLMVAVALAIVRYLLKQERGTALVKADRAKPQPASATDPLPLPADTPRETLLDQAREAADRGDYDRAIVLLYSYQLRQLDANHLIQLRRGTTNRQYLHALLARPQLQQLLERTMIAFEDVFFGGRSLNADRFQTCWNALEPFHQELREGAA